MIIVGIATKNADNLRVMSVGRLIDGTTIEAIIPTGISTTLYQILGHLRVLVHHSLDNNTLYHIKLCDQHLLLAYNS